MRKLIDVGGVQANSLFFSIIPLPMLQCQDAPLIKQIAKKAAVKQIQ